jgi:hypothetical protein
MKQTKSEEWLENYELFLKSESTAVPKDVTERVFSRLKPLINPNAWFVFFKILAIHVAIGFASLSICHQFGMNPFHTDKSLSDWMMAVGGHNACMIGCGVLFISLSLLAASYFLTIEEVRALKRTELRQTLALSIVSLGIFVLAGAEIAVTIAGLWLLGAFIGGFLATEAAMKLKLARI